LVTSRRKTEGGFTTGTLLITGTVGTVSGAGFAFIGFLLKESIIASMTFGGTTVFATVSTVSTLVFRSFVHTAGIFAVYTEVAFYRG